MTNAKGDPAVYELKVGVTKVLGVCSADPPMTPGDYFTGAGGFYEFHTADLMAWSDNFVKIRFALSTNDTGIGSGWLRSSSTSV